MTTELKDFLYSIIEQSYVHYYIWHVSEKRYKELLKEFSNELLAFPADSPDKEFEFNFNGFIFHVTTDS